MKEQPPYSEWKAEGRRRTLCDDLQPSEMKYSDLVRQKRDETVAMFEVTIHVLPSGYRFDLETREPDRKSVAKQRLLPADIYPIFTLTR